MRFKLDENFGKRTSRLFREAGHDVQTVTAESLSGASDQRLFEACRTERRCLVTFDLDFADILRFPPSQSAGIAVLRIPHNPSIELLAELVRRFLETVRETPLENCLWIVEPGRIRIHQAES